MPRKTTANPAVFDRVHYSNPQIIADWKKKVPSQTPQTEQTVGRTVTKAQRQAKPIEKPARKAPAEKTKPQTKGEVLTFIQKFPATFQLDRREHPQDFERMTFVLKALSTDPTRPAFALLHVEQTKSGSRLVATDGLRMHVTEIGIKIPGGNYKPHITKDTISFEKPVKDVSFPNWQRVVPDEPEKKGIIDLADAHMGKDHTKTGNLSLAFVSFMEKTGETINLRYLEDLPKTEWAVYTQGKHKPVMLKQCEEPCAVPTATHDTFAVIMPMNAA
jgi:hypothetical protein